MKIRRISDFQARISFPNFDSYYEKYLSAFRTTELGMIHQAIPWVGLSKSIGLKEHVKLANSGQTVPLKQVRFIGWLKSYFLEKIITRRWRINQLI